MTNQNPTVEQEVLLQIDREIQFSNELYQDSGSHFYLGQMDALSNLRNFILMISIDRSNQRKPDDVSIVDAIEPGETSSMDRIMMKIGAVGQSLRTVNSMVAAIA